MSDLFRHERIGRFKTFDLFLGLAGNTRTRGWFHEIADKDDRHTYFESSYSFYVVPGGAMGGVDHRVLEVFYGQRPIDSIREFRALEMAGRSSGFPQLQTRLITEEGARLHYNRTDRGSVVCTLYPAKSELSRPTEDAIILGTFSDPRPLTGRPLLEKHWSFLISYFECTSVDGRPDIRDRARIWWLLFSRRTVVHSATTKPLMFSVLQEIIKWSLTVGFSGALLASVQMLMSKDVHPSGASAAPHSSCESTTTPRKTAPWPKTIWSFR
jgi:hypothetical protein